MRMFPETKTVHAILVPPPTGTLDSTADVFPRNDLSRPNQHRTDNPAQACWFNRWCTILLLVLSGCLAIALSGCAGYAVNSGALVLSSTSVAFTNVPVGQTATITVSLTNQGPAPIQISGLSVTGQPFSLSSQYSLPATISAGGTYSLSVQFAPVTPGLASGQLTITNSFSTGGAAVIALSGTGAQAAGVLSALSCSNASITGSGTDACTVTLSAAAPSSGLSVSLSSSNTAVSVPATVTVPANATSAGFTATVSSVATAQAATLTATVGAVSEIFVMQLNAAVPTLSISSASLTFGNVSLNAPSTQSVTLTSAGTAPVTISAATVTGTGFTLSGATFPVTLNPGQATTLSVQFDPTIAGAATGQLTITDNSSTGSTALIALSGTGTSVAAALSALSCGSTSITGSGTDACTVTLSAAAPSGGLTVNLSSSSAAVSVPATVTVPANATSAAFTATVSSVTTAQTVTLTASSGSVSQTFALQLNAAVPTLSINATSVAFGNVTLNAPATQSVTLTSTGTASVTVSAATVTGTGFTLSGATFPVTLNPSQATTLSVQFDPTVIGAATGLLTVTSNSSTGSTAVIALSGTGEAASYSVDLSWDAPISSPDPVAGYNIYRSTGSSSTYQLLNSTVDSLLTFVDSTVQNGLVYVYMVESVDASGVESVPSNTFSVSIP